MRNCRYCGAPIPGYRNNSAMYCNNECYYAAKKARSMVRYNSLKESQMEIKTNEIILAKLFVVQQLKYQVTVKQLMDMGFNFGVYSKEFTSETGKIWKMVGNMYAYHIGSGINDFEPNAKPVLIWKMK